MYNDKLQDILSINEQNTLNSFDIATKAHNKWNRKEHFSAAILFNLAAKKARLEFEKGLSEVNNEMNYVCREAYNLFEAGYIENALPLLTKTCDYDWNANGLHNDNHMVEWAYTYKLIAASGDINKFKLLFDEAVVRCNKIGRIFPKIHPKQEILLDIAINLNEKDIITYIVELIKKRKPISKDLRTKLKKIESQRK